MKRYRWERGVIESSILFIISIGTIVKNCTEFIFEFLFAGITDETVLGQLETIRNYIFSKEKEPSNIFSNLLPPHWKKQADDCVHIETNPNDCVIELDGVEVSK
jgi:hypothetical protein